MLSLILLYGKVADYIDGPYSPSIGNIIITLIIIIAIIYFSNKHNDDEDESVKDDIDKY